MTMVRRRRRLTLTDLRWNPCDAAMRMNNHSHSHSHTRSVITTTAEALSMLVDRRRQLLRHRLVVRLDRRRMLSIIRFMRE